MKKLLFLLLIAANYSFAQNFPYLNASSGNPDFFTDNDTNMYMIHGNRLAKLNKNFNPVWVNTYGNLTLKNVLLSKTGSMYFTAVGVSTTTTQQYLVGKIEANGTLSWTKSTTAMSLTVAGSTITSATLNSESLFLDSNNNLLLCGAVPSTSNVALIKMDTLGNIIKARLFSISYSGLGGPAISANILYEASGAINIVTTGGVNFAAGVILENFSYSSAGDSVTYASQSSLAGCANCTSAFKFLFYKSKTRADVFYLFGHKWIDYPSPSATPYHFILCKYTFNSLQWSREYNWPSAPATMSKSLDEDEKGNVFCVVNPGNSMGAYHSGFVKFDSTGAFNGNWNKYFNGYNYNNGITYPDDRVNVLYSNKVFMNVMGAGYPANPLTVEAISPALTMSCSTTALLNPVLPFFSGTLSPVQRPTQYQVTAITMANISVIVNAVNNFSVAQNFCATVDIPENSLNDKFTFYPNPVKDLLSIKGEQEAITEIKIYDITGRRLLYSKTEEICTSVLPPGVYVVSIHTGLRVINKKFVKE